MLKKGKSADKTNQDNAAQMHTGFAYRTPWSLVRYIQPDVNPVVPVDALKRIAKLVRTSQWISFDVVKRIRGASESCHSLEDVQSV